MRRSVTAVGATQGFPEAVMLQPDDTPDGDFSSSGGFSNFFPAPDWQASAVQGYLSALGDTNTGLYNTSGRGFPDVAAYGHAVQTFLGGAPSPADGTSCSSPIFASVVALLNDRLLAAGKAQLGFLNPWLYANPQALNDVTLGNNAGCGSEGFPAMAGWDPATGLGSPNFDALLRAAGLSS
jgi:tripeptidyl-peptidase-1